MTSICNYSHPELQITHGLARQETGYLFPYNPEFYENASGLYGPGTIYCWYMLLASVLANWLYYVSYQPDAVPSASQTDESSKKPGISNDVLGALAYPAFAATDLLVQGFRMLGTEYRALAILCLRFPNTSLNGFGSFNHTQLHLNEIPPDILGLGQRVIDITGPLTVCYTAASVQLLLMGVLVCSNLNWLWDWKLNFSTHLIVFASHGYTVLCLAIFHFSLDDLGISFMVVFFEAWLPLQITGAYILGALLGVALLSMVILLIQALVRMDRGEAANALMATGLCLFLLATLVILLLAIHRDGLRIVPDLAIRVDERDQLATLIVGVVTLAFTLFDLGRRSFRERREEEPVDEEMQVMRRAETIQVS
ncbi:hypothetical protein F66182_4329 [Fusarium sp. NRRL 66182]|nr:hypothetical protein F66182_4329 [Fusarium sp. NRRL 66182]